MLLRFLALTSALVTAATGVSVQLPGGTHLIVPTADAESLRLVIETLALVDADRLGGVRPC